MRKVIIYSDGSFKKKTKKGGYAGLMECEGHKLAVVGNRANTTNNQMELMGPISCLNKLQEPCEVEVVSDSRYAVNTINEWLENWEQNGFKNAKNQPVKNQKDLKKLAPLLKEHKVAAKWVKGHNGHLENEIADDLADIAARERVGKKKKKKA